jgi:FkbM family methyltransferase
MLWQIRKVLNLFPFEQQFSRSRIIASNRNDGVSALINNQGMYDPNNMRLLREVLDQPGRVVFDVGANIGSYTLLASEQPAQVFAFEPHPETFRILKSNVDLNGRSNVNLFCLALGSKNGKAFLTDRASSAINQLVEHSERELHSERGLIKVHTVRADSFIDEVGVVPEILKVDAEGHEYEVLEGFGDYLTRIDLLLIEIQKRNREAVLEKASMNGLRGPYSLDFRRKTFFASYGESSEVSIFFSDREINRQSNKGYRFQESPS